MCGICGYAAFDAFAGEPPLGAMTAALAHRGPDGSATWRDEKRRIGLGHTRLSIIDLQSGAQPMKSVDSRFVIVFNGEIYNFRSLRQELNNLGHAFATQSDTEVILEAYRRWGNCCLERLRGMFAFALYDTRDHKLFLARDRTGVKPLYHHRGNGGFIFGSELKALLAAPAVPRRLDYQALAEFLRLGYALPPATFFSDVRELEPGSWLELSPSGIARGQFWEWRRTPADWGEDDALEISEQALIESLRDHLVSDVPIGAFLSGGIDSSLLVALLVRKLGVQIDTFHVRFSESRYDESEYARAVAERLGTHHHEVMADDLGRSGDDVKALDFADRVLAQFDQPFGDSSAIPTYLVCREIRKHVKVAISGDGGDEMFGGYSRFWYADLAHRLAGMPPWLLWGVTKTSSALRMFSPDGFRETRRLLTAAAPGNGDRLLSICNYIGRAELPLVLQPAAYERVGDYEPRFGLNGLSGGPSGADLIDSTVRFTLPGDYLRKVDIMSSAHGLEVRVPFLGEPVLECAAQLPHSLKYRGSRNKLLLRKLAERYLPPKVAAKPKWGFGIPLDGWLGRLGREAVRRMLESPRAEIHAVIRRKYSSPLLESFVTRQWDRSALSRFGLYQRVYALWSLERWFERWRPSL
ncbi:MAG TPA: asparagine synthase (glutamine-hydrolyzing) [Terriglobia bacterium]|nr:asparagine synthase (glutamine-hydrolyzing) [Terriglobia bacterium]